MVQITVDTSQFDDMGERFLAGAPVVRRHLTVAMTRSTAQVQADAMAAAPVDTGTLRRSITTEVTPLVGRVGSNLPYAPVVEYGRRVGAPMPPSGALTAWMQRHGIPVEAEFVVRRSIARRGIRARPYLVPALERNMPAIDREFARAMERAVAELVG